MAPAYQGPLYSPLSSRVLAETGSNKSERRVKSRPYSSKLAIFPDKLQMQDSGNQIYLKLICLCFFCAYFVSRPTVN